MKKLKKPCTGWKISCAGWDSEKINKRKTNIMVDAVISSLEGDLDFIADELPSRLHNFHSFPAKFPPALPRRFIQLLTNPNDLVLDPMCGSGTTLVEGFLLGRKTIGFDIDPLALLISNVKTTKLKPTDLLDILDKILQNATQSVIEDERNIIDNLNNKWDPETKGFIDYWFSPTTQIELYALLNQIDKLRSIEIQNFFKLIFSSTIITKSGGVSLALDLAHTRPHRAKVVNHKNINTYNYQLIAEPKPTPYQTKTIKSAISEFKKKALVSIRSITDIPETRDRLSLALCDSRNVGLADETIDLIITSPPYASNAIDYMRAHKFSLVWFGYSISELSKKRGDYIGSATFTSRMKYEGFGKTTASIINNIAQVDEKKSLVVAKYYSESKEILTEMYRVLKPKKTMIYVVGTSIIKGVDIQIADCLSELGEQVGFTVPKIGSRAIDRNRRMLPVSVDKKSDSLIEQRIHNEYVIAFTKRR